MCRDPGQPQLAPAEVLGAPKGHPAPIHPGVCNATPQRGAQLDRATDEIRCLLASADGSEVHTSELEKQIDRARSAEAAMLGLESFREAAALLYMNETGSSWRPAGGSRLNHSAALTSAVIDGRDFLRARSEARRRAALPEGTPVIFAGGRLAFATAEEAKAFADSVWTTLDRVRERVADLGTIGHPATAALIE